MRLLSSPASSVSPFASNPAVNTRRVQPSALQSNDNTPTRRSAYMQRWVESSPAFYAYSPEQRQRAYATALPPASSVSSLESIPQSNANERTRLPSSPASSISPLRLLSRVTQTSVRDYYLLLLVPSLLLRLLRRVTLTNVRNRSPLLLVPSLLLRLLPRVTPTSVRSSRAQPVSSVSPFMSNPQTNANGPLDSWVQPVSSVSPFASPPQSNANERMQLLPSRVP
jgi:hypothetical protein